jgi:hypothetical protein
MPSRHRGGVKVELYPFSTSTLEGGGCSMPRPGCFTPRKGTWCLLYRRLSGPWGFSVWVQKISSPPGLKPRTLQSIASCYTNKFSACSNTNILYTLLQYDASFLLLHVVKTIQNFHFREILVQSRR